MGRSNILVRELTLVAFIMAIAVVLSCSADEVPIPDHLRGEPACMWIMDTRMYFGDGTSWLIHDDPSNYTGAACVCMSEAEFKSQSRSEELNDMALEICEDLAARRAHVWNECVQNYEMGNWLDDVYWARGKMEHPSGTALGCYGE